MKKRRRSIWRRRRRWDFRACQQVSSMRNFTTRALTSAALQKADSDGKLGDGNRILGRTWPPISAIYAIVPRTASSQEIRSSEEIFVHGGHQTCTYEITQCFSKFRAMSKERSARRSLRTLQATSESIVHFDRCVSIHGCDRRESDPQHLSTKRVCLTVLCRNPCP